MSQPWEESSAELVETKSAASQFQGVPLTGQPFAWNPVKMLFAFIMQFKQSGLPEDLEMSGHFVLWHFQPGRDLIDAQMLFQQKPDDPQSDRLAECLQCRSTVKICHQAKHRRRSRTGKQVRPNRNSLATSGSLNCAGGMPADSVETTALLKRV